MKKTVIGILAHVDAGKTTLSEGLLFTSGMIRRQGRVDHQDAFLDTNSMERARGITIFSKQAMLQTKELEMTLLDTPGHVDFSAEMERTLQVLDYAILVISAGDGVQVHTETLWRLLRKHRIPVFLYVNKMDLPHPDRAGILEELRERLDDSILDFSAEPYTCRKTEMQAAAQQKDMLSAGMLLQPSKEETAEFFETAAMGDEAAMEEFLETEQLSGKTLGRLIADRKIFPCCFGSALKLWGVADLIRKLEFYVQERVYSREFGARVFKISRDDQGNRLTWMKITGGSLRVKQTLTDAGSCGKDGHRIQAEEAWEEKADQLRLYSGEKFTLLETANAGTVCAVCGLSQTFPGEGLGREQENETPVLEPVMNYQLLLPPGCDVHKMLIRLRELEEEDPLLRVLWQERLQEIHIQLMGPVQKEVLLTMIRERFGVRAAFGEGNIVYKETITAPVIGVGHFEPLRHYAEVHLLMEPAEQGSGITLASACSEDVLDLNWQRLILTHLQEKEHVGVLTGSPITDMKITVLTGRAHVKHTEGGDFRQATYRAVRNGLMQASSILLEPWYDFTLEVPMQLVGRAMSDIQQMSGTSLPPEIENDMAVLHGEAPASEMRGYIEEVNTYTSGKGHLNCRMKGYCPCHNQEEVLEKYAYDPLLDTDNPADSVFCSHGAGTIIPWDRVTEYMHMESGWKLPVQEETENAARPSVKRSSGRGSASYDGSWEQDKELEEIFARTFGSGKSRPMDRYRSVSYDAPAKPKGEPDPKYVQKQLQKKKTGKEYLLVDGYNIIFAWEELKTLASENLDAARYALMDLLCNYQGYAQCILIVVFDAYKVKGGQGSVGTYHNIHVVYTKEAETADAYIEKTTKDLAREHRVRVATSDGLEQIIVMGEGAIRISARELRMLMEQAGEDMQAFFKDKNAKFSNRLSLERFTF